MVSNPLGPDLMTASERLSVAASLLARAILRRRLRIADGRKPALSPSAPLRVNSVEGKPLDVLREARDECVEMARSLTATAAFGLAARSQVETHE